MKKVIPFLVIITLLTIGCGKNVEEQGGVTLSPAEVTQVQTQAKTVFGALPDKMPGSEADTPERIALGDKLFHENALSANNKQSCNTCHDLKTAGVDNKAVSLGALGTTGTRNSQTVLNAGFQFVQFWDGRAKDLKQQAKGPVLNPVEMALKTDKDAEKAIAAIPEYTDLFAKAFPGVAKPVTFDNIAEAIAAFERTLVSKSKFDYFLNGNTAAMSNEEIAGLKTFMNTGCITCHVGPLLGGTMYQKMGLVKPYKNTTDLGRFTVTKNEADKFMFKVAMLRNIALTAPYFHDGSVSTLEEAVKTMADINLGKQLSDADVKSIVAFLKALDGEKK
jgi:cytochrome c peroxidase